jgi:hypothetical protein
VSSMLDMEIDNSTVNLSSQSNVYIIVLFMCFF